jgi:putative peptidoglycan lipid II flippase
MRRSVSLVFGGTALSKGIGLLREVIMSAFFGTGPVVAAFRVAIVGTSVPVQFLTSDAFNYAFIPLYKQFGLESKEKAQSLVWALMAVVGLCAVSVGIALWFASTEWVHVLTPGLDAGTARTASAVLKEMSFGVPLFFMATYLMFVAAAGGDFLPISVRPGAQNVGLIMGVIGAYWFGRPGLFALGFTVSYGFLVLWWLVRTYRRGHLALPASFAVGPLKDALKAFWATLCPIAPLPFFLQGTIVVERIVASLVGLIAVSAIDYARFLSDTVIAMISVPIGIAGITHWSGIERSEVRNHLRRVLPVVLLVTIPISAVMVANATVLIRAAFARGAFDGRSVSVTAEILRGAGLGLWAQVLGYVLMKALSAQRRNRAVLGIMTVSLAANSAFDLLAYSRLGAVTLGLGNSLYGAGLLIGGLMALRLWGDLLRRGGGILLGAGIYIWVARYLPMRGASVVRQLCEAGLLAVVFWATWIALSPQLRRLVVDLMRSRGSMR